MDKIRALTIAIDCVMSSGIDSGLKNEVIDTLIEIENDLEPDTLSIGDLVRVTKLDRLDIRIDLKVGEVARITGFCDDDSGIMVVFEDTIGDYALEYGQFEKVEVK